MWSRCAEGADFKNEAARAVVVVGVPYAPLFDAAIRLKREHESAISSKKGDEWYATDAFRQVSPHASPLRARGCNWALGAWCVA